MKRVLNGVAAKLISTVTVFALTMPVAMAAADSDRILLSQGQYAGDVGNVWVLAIKILMFAAGLMAIGFSSWQIAKDYIMAKSDHEKKFSPGVLAAGMLIGSLLCYPGGAAIIGGDLSGAGQTVTIDAGEFEREGTN